MDQVYRQLSRECILAGLAPSAQGWVRELRVFGEIDSTSLRLMTRAGTEKINGVVYVAERQTNGRGRRGRTWLTPAGGSIALSFGREVAVSVAEVAPLSLIVGLAIANAMRRSDIHGISLKWPNDVLVDGAKVGGVLIELAETASPLILVIGVGINIGCGAEVGASLGVPVGDVLAQHPYVSRNDLIAEVISSIHEFTNRFESQGFSGMRSEWEQLHFHQNRRVKLIGPNESLEGVARGVTACGELILETSSGLRYFNTGEVSLRGELGPAEPQRDTRGT